MSADQLNYPDPLIGNVPVAAELIGGKRYPARISVDADGAVVDPATSARQDAQTALLTSIGNYLDGLEGYVDGIEGALTSILAKIIAAPATETTSAAILAKLIASPATEATLASILSALATVPTRSMDGIITSSVDITRPADTTAYVAGDAWSDSTSAPTAGGFTLTGAVRASGKSALLTDVLITSSNNIGGLQGQLYLFDAAVTNINDNAAFAVSDAEIKTLVAKIPFTLEGGGNNSHVHIQGLAVGITTVGSANLRFLIKVTGGYNPISAEVLTVRAKFAPVN